MSESKAHQVEIREVDGQTLRTLVDYIYTAEIEVTEDNVQVGDEEKRFCVVLFFFFSNHCFIHNGNGFNNFERSVLAEKLLC